jgi:cytochrome P450
MSTPAGAVTLADLENDPHPVLARLRAAAPVCWVPVLGTWLVTGYQLAVDVLRDARTFTVDDPRFTTARVVGPSMLSLDGAPHTRHRGPFNQPFRHDEVHARLASFTRSEADRLVSAIRPRGEAELRRAVAGPLAVAVMAEALGLGDTDPARILAWYDGIVTAVQAAGAGQAAAAKPDAAAAKRDAAAATPDAATAKREDATGAAAYAEQAASQHELIASPHANSLLPELAGALAEDDANSN